MQTFDQSLMQLFRQNLITYEEALRQSSNPDDFALRVSGISATSDSSWDNFEQKDEAGAAPGKPAASPAAGKPAARQDRLEAAGRARCRAAARGAGGSTRGRRRRLPDRTLLK